ncbi:Putative cell wall binding repeat 2 [Peptostreptococcus russellii]|uniref:Putative cell wall binding repeat 2 n=1 Tax=Peptostreptococcus russellii TaxID=215200 RepID=A0A1H8ITQ3_9FIRM|nr:cell wall-binding repeat-containing protein [Peptostreptococcus russellii]SEN71535.1 Putative cell wall binding repeat 2 [Peptostreptococcus russellii]
MKKNTIKSIALSIAIFISSTIPALADTNVTRISGKDRHETNMKVEQKYFNNADGNLAVIAPSNNFRVALYGSYMANALNVPFYIIPNSGLSQSMINELSRLGVKRSYILGDYKQLNRSIDNSLKSIGIKVDRFYDTYDYENNFFYPITSYIDTPIFNTFHAGEPRGDTSVGIIINDSKFPDLLAAIPFVSELTRKEATYLASCKDLESTDGFRFIIGGYQSVPNYFETFEGDSLGLNLHSWDGSYDPESSFFTGRIAGNNRYETAVEIARSYKPVLKKNINTVVIVDGTNYPDALASGTAAVHNNAAILLTEPNSLDENTKNYIIDNNIKNIIIVGGENSVSSNVEKELKSLN